MNCSTCGIEVPIRYCPKCGRDCQPGVAQSQSSPNVRQKAPTEADLAKQRLSVVPSLSEFIGQQDCVRRLKVFGDLYASEGGAPEHILLIGDDGLGKSRLGRAFAKAYNSGLHESSAESFKKKGDLTGEITSMQPGDAWIIQDIHMLRQPMLDVLRIALQEFRIDLVIGQGPGARVHPYELSRFTCIATAPRLTDIQPELSKCFTLCLQLQPYSVLELESIADALATENGVVLSEGVGRLIAGVSDGNPGTVERFVKRFSRFGKSIITAEDAAQVLAAFGLNPISATSTVNATNADDLNTMSGIEFEKLITNLLRQMGFQAEMTRTTGDGGIDIVAHLGTPLIGGRYLIQCKRFADTLVGAPMIREFYGAVVADRKAIKGIFITTSSFTDQAREFALNLPLELIDGSRLRRLLADQLPTRD